MSEIAEIATILDGVQGQCRESLSLRWVRGAQVQRFQHASMMTIRLSSFFSCETQPAQAVWELRRKSRETPSTGLNGTPFQ